MSGRTTTFSAYLSPRAAVPSWGAAAARQLALMLHALRSRRILGELDPRLLKDIGVSRSYAQAEAARAPWDFEK